MNARMEFTALQEHS